MHPSLLMMCTLAAVLTGCSREPAPADSSSPARQAPVSATPSPTPVAAPADPAPSAIPASAPVKLVLSGEGLDFVTERGSVRHLVFGTPAAQAIDAVSQASAACRG